MFHATIIIKFYRAISVLHNERDSRDDNKTKVHNDNYLSKALKLPQKMTSSSQETIITTVPVWLHTKIVVVRGSNG